MTALLTTADVTGMLGKGTTVQVTDIATGKSIARQWFQQARHAWPSVAIDVAAWFECDLDDVDLIEPTNNVNGTTMTVVAHTVWADSGRIESVRLSANPSSTPSCRCLWMRRRCCAAAYWRG